MNFIRVRSRRVRTHLQPGGSVAVAQRPALEDDAPDLSARHRAGALGADVDGGRVFGFLALLRKRVDVAVVEEAVAPAGRGGVLHSSEGEILRAGVDTARGFALVLVVNRHVCDAVVAVELAVHALLVAHEVEVVVFLSKATSEIGDARGGE